MRLRVLFKRIFPSPAAPRVLALNNNRGFALAAVLASVFILQAGIYASIKYNQSQAASQSSALVSQVKQGMAVVRDFLIQNAGDPDNDGFYELPKEAAGNAIPGTIPVNKADTWGTNYIYCTWDLGAPNSNPAYSQINVPPPVAGLIGRIISAGPDKTFQTACTDISAKGDDIVLDIYESAVQYSSAALGGWQTPQGQNYIQALNPAAYVGIGTTVASPPTHRLELASSTGATGGLALGDVEVFRSAANTIQINGGGVLTPTADAITIGISDPVVGAWLRNDGFNANLSTNVGDLLLGYGGNAAKTIRIGNGVLGAVQVAGSAPAGSIVVDLTGRTTLGGVLNASQGIQVGGVLLSDASRNLSNVGSISAVGLVASGNINTTSGVYQVNGVTVIDSSRNFIGANMTAAGVVNSTSGYQVSGTTVIDPSRNLINIAGVTSNLIPTASSAYNLGALAAQWANIYGTNIYQAGNRVLDTTSVSGTANYLAKFTGSNSVANSQILDDGTNVAINSTAQAGNKLYIKGATSDTTTNALNVVNLGGTNILVARDDGRVGFGGITAPGTTVDVNGVIRTNNQLISTIATGTAPLQVSSTTLVTNLNADYLSGQHGSFYQNASNINAGMLGTLYGGTGINGSAASNGQLLIGNGSGYTLATLTGTANQVNVTNAAGGITLSLPQSIATTSSPTFAGLIVNGNETISGNITRTTAGKGFLDGNYTVGENSTTSGAIYTIGASSWGPTATTLGNMYGIGYGYSGQAGITATGAPANKWGMYVASIGVSRIFLDADDGNIYANGTIYSGGVALATSTGTNATGTWGINITGNAATATTATNLTGFSNSNSANPVDANVVSTNGIGYTNANSGAPLFGQTDGALFSQAYSPVWMSEIYQDYRTGHIALRGKNNGTWQSWLVGLDSGNYNTYAPTLIGGGASGTWGINVTGNAATAGGYTFNQSLLTTASPTFAAVTATNFYGTFNGNATTSTMTTYVNSPDGDRNAATKLPTSNPNAVRYDFVGAGSAGTGGNYAGLMTYAPWAGTTSSTGDASYQLAFGSTAANGGGIPMLNIRKGIDSTWNSWFTLIHSGNITNYAPTLTGTGASGTWGINITGNAATAGGYTFNQALLTSSSPTFAAVTATDFYGTLNGSITGNAPTATTATNLSGGTVSATTGVFNSSLTLAGIGTNAFIAGTGDGASYATYNFALSGWQGMAFYNPTGGGAYPNQTTGYIDFRNGILDMKGGFKVNGSPVLTAGNVNSYAPTLTGAGASGSWSINVTGSAGSVNGYSFNQALLTSSSPTFSAVTATNFYGTLNGSITGNASTVTTLTPTQIFTAISGQSNSDWYRTSGQTGWYNSTYAVGVYATQAGRVDLYNGASLYVPGAITSIGSVTASQFNGSGAGLSAGSVPITALTAGDYSSTITSGSYGINITGNSVTAGGYSFNQALLTSSSPTFFAVTATNFFGTLNGSITGNAATVGGLSVGGVGNSGANQIVRTDGSGYIESSYFYTSGGGSERNNSSPTYLAGFNASDFYIRSYATSALVVGFATNATNATNAVYATAAGRAYPYRSDGTAISFIWSGQAGQPTWLWGGNDGVNMYVYNPSNFSVNYAATAGSATTAITATNAGYATTAGSTYYAP